MERGSPFDYRVEPHQASEEIMHMREWLDIRSCLERCFDEESLCKILKRAATCEHPDAVFLTKVIGNASNTCEVTEMLINDADKTEDPRSLCFSAVFFDPRLDKVRFKRLKQAADAGYAYAQIKVAEELFKNPAEHASALALATQSAHQGDSAAYEFFAEAYRFGRLLAADEQKMLFYFRWVCYLQDQNGICIDEYLEELDPERWFWLGRRASSRWSQTYLSVIVEFRTKKKQIDSQKARLFGVKERKKYQDPRGAVFEIGRALALVPQLREKKRDEKEEFGRVVFMLPELCKADREREEEFAIRFFRYQSGCCRAAIDQWCLIATQMNAKINRDIRKKIALLIWASRNESVYE